jgi:hypothetical protein
MVRLETLVGQLVTRMDNDHKAALDTRKDDRASIKELGERMERAGEKMEESVSNLASEMKKLAERTATNDNKAAGALDAGKWIAGTIIGVLGLVLTYQAGQRGTHYNPEPPAPQYSQKAR